jgi:fluoride exporter
MDISIGPHFLRKFLILMVAGGLGTVLRYGISNRVWRYMGTKFPWGTLSVNMVGCFLIGLLWIIFENKATISNDIKLFILVGFLGGFTTFSTFMLQTNTLIADSHWMLAAKNMLFHNIAGFACVFLGMGLGKLIVNAWSS